MICVVGVEFGSAREVEWTRLGEKRGVMMGVGLASWGESEKNKRRLHIELWDASHDAWMSLMITLESWLCGI